MKKIVLLALLFVTALGAGAQEKMLTAYLGCDGQMSFILNMPSGSTVMTLSCDEPYLFRLTSPQGGWWKIDEIWNAANDEDTTSLVGSDTGEYWIHYSALSLGTSNYGGQELHLRTAPDKNADIVFSFTRELELMPLDVHGDWVMVKVEGGYNGYDDVVGWIENEWLCSNPLTNCC